MGHIYADDKAKPSSAMAILGDFCFLAGSPDEELASYKPEWCTQDFIIIVPQNRQWGAVIEKCYGDKARKVVRYAMKKEPDIFNRNRLENIIEQLPSEYTLRMIDEPVFHECRKENWCGDLVSQFADYNSYQRMGLGVVVMRDEVPVAGASSYTVYQGGIEVEIDTKMEYRRRGLATVCGAKLILECLDRGGIQAGMRRICGQLRWQRSWGTISAMNMMLMRLLLTGNVVKENMLSAGVKYCCGREEVIKVLYG